MNTERGDKKLNKTKQSQKKGILNVGRCKKKKQDETRNYCKEMKNKISEYVSALGIKRRKLTLHKNKSMIKEILRNSPRAHSIKTKR